MNGIIVFPKQKSTDKEKNKKWIEDCVDAALELRYHDNYSIRPSMANKKANIDLFNGIMDEEDIEKVFNYMGVKNMSLPAKTQNYPIEIPKINLLVGEEARRTYRYVVKATSGDAITQIEEQKKEYVREKLRQFIGSPEKQDVGKYIKDLNKYVHYEYQDVREQMANGILRYFYKICDMPIVFNKGFYDVLICGEEIYNVDCIANNMVVRKCDPLTTYSIRGSNSSYIEDADIIIDDGYLSLGKVIDQFYEDLTKDQIRQLEENVQSAVTGAEIVFFSNTSEDGLTHNPKKSMSELSDPPQILFIDDGSAPAYTDLYDMEGNIRVSKVKWKSYREVKKRTYFDDNGEQQEDLVTVDYEPNTKEGETVKKLWITEWWECYKVADLYINGKPSPIQFRDMHNLSSCKSGYVGTYYNVGTSQSVSVYDRLKPYKYLYNVFMRRTELDFARNKGIIGELNLAAIPDGWTIDQVMYYAEQLGWMVTDPFTEGKKGLSQGKMAGNFNTFGGRTMDFSGAISSIKMNIEMLNYVEQKISDVTGISRQREGSVDNRETMGGVERAVTQSSYVTEHLFMMHDNTKKRVLEHMLEVGKYIYRRRKDRLQYIDNLTKVVVDIDGALLNEWCYGIFIEDGQDDKALKATFERLAQAAMQNDKLDFSKAIDIFSNDSISNIKHNIQEGEQEQAERIQAAEEGRNNAVVQSAEIARQTELDKQDREDRRLLLELENNLNIKILELQATNLDRDRDGVADNVELQKEILKMQAQYDKMRTDVEQREKDRQLKREEIAKKKQGSQKAR